MFIMKTFLLIYCCFVFIGVGEQLLAKAGVGFFFRKEGSFDAVALERISLCACVCISRFPAWVHCVLMHASVYVRLLMTL